MLYYDARSANYQEWYLSLPYKMVLPLNYQYNNEQQAGSGCVTFCAAFLD
jgi:hypothetical protein